MPLRLWANCVPLFFKMWPALFYMPALFWSFTHLSKTVGWLIDYCLEQVIFISSIKNILVLVLNITYWLIIADIHELSQFKWWQNIHKSMFLIEWHVWTKKSWQWQDLNHRPHEPQLGRQNTIPYMPLPWPCFVYFYS
jgi:hypothetical protein